jgi:ABC-type antimicrobial peptide transport system permease subunit
VGFETASGDYFASLDIPVVRGRALSDDDRPGAPAVVVISTGLAKSLFPRSDPIGARIRFEARAADTIAPWREIVGVVGDVRDNVASDQRPMLYASHWQVGAGGGQIVVRTAGDATPLVPALRRVLQELDLPLPLMMPRTLREVLDKFVSRQRFSMALMAAFASLALVLAALGIYAVMAYAVVARTREIGIRTALGAQRMNVLFLVLGQGMIPAVAGTAIGLAIAVPGASAITQLLSGVSPHDGATFGVATAVIIIVAMLACALPARAAMRVDPVEALRSE